MPCFSASKPSLPNVRFYCFDKLGSTNDVAKNLVREGAIKEECFVFSLEQNSGHGRYDRRFVSGRKKGVYLTYVLPVGGDFDVIASAGCFSAVAVAESVSNIIKTLYEGECNRHENRGAGESTKEREKSCKNLYGKDNFGEFEKRETDTRRIGGKRFALTVKWPNDVKLNGGKICGILPETVVADGARYLVLGAGLNINYAKEDFPAELWGKATSVFMETGRRTSVRACAESLANELRETLSYLKAGDKLGTADKTQYEKLLEKYRLLVENTGKKVRFGRNSERTGTVLGIDSKCALVINENGNTVSLNWGEVVETE